MDRPTLKRPVSVSIATVCIGMLLSSCGTSSPTSTPASSPATPVHVAWINGFAAPGTPARYNKVGILKVGSTSAKNVLVLEPGTSAGGTYFVPLAKWIVSKARGWQVWSVERRENLLEDQSMLNRAKAGTASSASAFNYYLGYLSDPSITHHFHSIPDSRVEFAKQWGMN